MSLLETIGRVKAHLREHGRVSLRVPLGSALALAAFTWTDRPIGFRAGALLLTGYFVYVGALLLRRA